MKKLLTLITIFSCINVIAQVKFEKLTLQNAIQKAASSGKIVFAQFVSDKCDQCNMVADKSFEDAELAKVIGEKCVAIKSEVSNADRQDFINRFNPTQSIGTFFISPDGELIHRYTSTTTRAAEYVAQIDKAYNKITEGKVTLRELNEEWNNNPKDVAAMEANLNKRTNLGLPTDSLLEIYIKRLPEDSLTSVRVLNFIAQQAPSIFSKAHIILHKDRDLFLQAWYAMPLPTRININNRITYKSMQKAIAEKSRSMASSVAGFTAGTYNTDPVQGPKAYDKQMLDYYVGIKDTSAYLKQAELYFDKYYMTVPVDKIKEQDSLRIKQMLAKAPADTIKDTGNPAKFTIRKGVSFAPQTQFFTSELNRGAWLLYTSASNENYLKKALAWAKRSLDFYESPEAMDTYARILYKTGNSPEAIKWQKRAIEIYKERKFPAKEFEQILAKMERGEKQLDAY
jgi:hypothetical protein